MLKNVFILILATFVCFSCSREKEKVDLIVHNAVIYSVDSAFTMYEAMAIKNGVVVALSTSKKILHEYTAGEITDANGQTILPGIIDAHCHFLGYGLGLSKIDLVGTKSFNEVVERVYNSSKKKTIDGKQVKEADLAKGSENKTWLLGRGWDQNDWDVKTMPTNEKLDSLFPNRPVLLTRIDGHAALANTEALKRAGITAGTRISGGEIIVSGNRPTGLLVDNAVDLVKSVLPKAGKEELEGALLNAQNNCLAMGITTVDDAGLMKPEIDVMDELQRSGKLKMRVYAMLSDSLPNYDFYLKHGPYKTDRLNVRSFKYYVDGALGSRGACLFRDYSDKPGWKGFLLSPPRHFEKYAAILDAKGFQMNAHCIGDSALNMIMNIYTRYCNEKGTHRWRIEHAQVTGTDDFKNFSMDIIPSVQPTHATSDMYWVVERLGPERSKNAYAYKELLKASGIVALGTDFPVEDISPFKTFFAAVTRQDAKGFPEKGFQKENALTREETLKGMTIWAAYANFEETEKGSLEKGKVADFIILDRDLMKCGEKEILGAKVLATYINGEKVFSGK
jgi:predicted amidohydrolase YtcJ